MSAIKKTKNKPSPAPATDSAAPKTSTRKKTAVAAKVSPPVSLAEPPPLAVASTPAVVETVPSAPVVTTVTARVDVGFGNGLYVRGEGPGLSWERGVPMNNLAADLWQISLPESARAYTLKFLINDTVWCTGPDFTVYPGSSATLVPQF